MSSVFTPTQNGAYAVVITQDNCTDTSYCYAITGVTGIASFNLQQGASVYPNPNQGKLSVTVSQPLKDATIRIVNLLGQALQVRHRIKGSSIDIDMTSLPSGAYFLELREAGAMATFKVIKE